MSRKLTHWPASRGAPPSRLLASARRPVGIWGVIGGKKTHRWPHGHPPFSVGKPDGDPGVICRQPRHGKSPNGDRTAPAGVRRETAGSSLDTLILSAVISIWKDLWDVMKTTMGYKN